VKIGTLGHDSVQKTLRHLFRMAVCVCRFGASCSKRPIAHSLSAGMLVVDLIRHAHCLKDCVNTWLDYSFTNVLEYVRGSEYHNRNMGITLKLQSTGSTSVQALSKTVLSFFGGVSSLWSNVIGAEG
jgi:hypothetical protein